MIYKKVKDFNVEILGIVDRPLGAMSPDEAEISFISLHEEADEFGDAAGVGDLVGMVDAVCDSMYFGFGILHKLGISESQFEQIFEVIHRANMSKTFGTNAKRDTGAADAVKPEDWQSPEESIKSILEQSETQH